MFTEVAIPCSSSLAVSLQDPQIRYLKIMVRAMKIIREKINFYVDQNKTEEKKFDANSMNKFPAERICCCLSAAE